MDKFYVLTVQVQVDKKGAVAHAREQAFTEQVDLMLQTEVLANLRSLKFVKDVRVWPRQVEAPVKR